MTVCQLICGGTGTQRQEAIAACLDPGVSNAVILEGLEPDQTALTTIDKNYLRLSVIATACPCCSNGMVMRVTLDRMLQQHPTMLFISLANPTHLSHLVQFLSEARYAKWVSLTATLNLDHTPLQRV